MSNALHLSVNVDHIATLRQARRTTYPDPVAAAHLAERAGASGITVHLRGDRRHVQDDDVRRLRDAISGKLNLEMAAGEEMLKIAVDLQPGQVTLVPERPEEITTEGGLDVIGNRETLRRAADYLTEAGIQVSLFLDPDLKQLDALTQLGAPRLPGFEINTDAYTKATPETLGEELMKIVRVARAGAERGFRVYAGHGLTTGNVGPIAALPEIEELNIGHWLVGRAALVGMEAAVREMLGVMSIARG